MTSAVSALAAACVSLSLVSVFSHAVYALFIRKWSTVLQHRTMVSTCRTHWLIWGYWQLLNLCVFSQWKLRFPRENLTQFPSVRVTLDHIDLLACGLIRSCSGLELQDPVSISNDIKTSYLKISQILETTRFVFRIVQLLWNLTVMHIGSSAADVPVKFQSNTIIYAINLADSSVWIRVWSVQNLVMIG